MSSFVFFSESETLFRGGLTPSPAPQITFSRLPFVTRLCARASFSEEHPFGRFLSCRELFENNNEREGIRRFRNTCSFGRDLNSLEAYHCRVVSEAPRVFFARRVEEGKKGTARRDCIARGGDARKEKRVPRDTKRSEFRRLSFDRKNYGRRRLASRAE